jgi:hypothetical protein
VVGLIAICLGLIPLFGLGAIIGGIVAVVFGLLRFARARRGVAANKTRWGQIRLTEPTSWRRTRSSTSLDDDARPSIASQVSSRLKIQVEQP